MGALADYGAYQSRLQELGRGEFLMSASSGRSVRLAAVWRQFVPSPASPTASVALNDSSDIAISPLPTVSGAGRLTILGANVRSSVPTGACLILADILNHSGGLDSTLTTEQTTGLPTASLTRYTSGEGVMAGLLIMSTIGAVATTFTIKYTNQAGTPGRISTETVIGGIGWRESGSLLPVPLASGDTGVRSVESVTLAASTAGGGASLGVVLFKPLAMMAVNNAAGDQQIDAVTSGGFVGSLAQAEPGACLSLLAVTNTGQLLSGSVFFAEV